MPDLKLGGFSEGANNVFREDSLRPSQLRSAVNVDVLPEGKIRRRLGYSLLVPMSDARSAYVHQGYVYVADEGALKRVDLSDLSVESLAPIPASAALSYAVLNEYLYISSGDPQQSYRINSAGALEFWAPEFPEGQPTLSVVPLGALPAGDYQVAVAFLRGAEESGTGRAAGITLTETGAIQLTSLPKPERNDTTHIRVYASTANGTVLYSYGDFPAAAPAISISNTPSGKQLETQFLEPLPAGHIIRNYRGRLYSAVSNILFYSQALRYSQTNRSQDFIAFPERVTMVRPVENGLFVGTRTKALFLSGNTPGELQQTIVHHAGVVEGTDTVVPVGVFGFESLTTGTVAVWWSTSGTMVIGLPNGQVQIVREGELSLPEFTRGATMLREENGVQQLLSVLQQPKSEISALAAKDEAVVTVHRRGIEI